MNNQNILPKCEHGEKDRDWSNLMIPQDLGVKLDHLRLLVPKKTPAPLPPIVIDKGTLELRKLKVHLDMSEETNCFSAEVWAQGAMVGHASNEGRGGGTVIHPKERGSLDAVEAWARSLPPESSYHRLYETILAVESDFAEKQLDDIKPAWWFSTRGVDLESLVDNIVQKAANRKGLRSIGSWAVFGPGKDTGERPGVMKFKKKIQPLWLAEARKYHDWAVLLTDFLDLPYHYYPAPHPFASRLGIEQKIRHKATGQEGIPYYLGVTDHQVVMQLGERGDNNRITGEPGDFEFVQKEEPAPAKVGS